VEKASVIESAAFEVEHHPAGSRLAATDDGKPGVVAATHDQGDDSEMLAVRADDGAAAKPARRCGLAEDPHREPRVPPRSAPPTAKTAANHGGIVGRDRCT
jgi:hypothetical protein